MSSDEATAKQAITEVLYRYCRSLDRMDAALYASVFVPGAPLEYGDFFSGTAEEFRTWVWAAHAGMQSHSHQIANVLVDLAPDGRSAGSESYVTVCLRMCADEQGIVRDIVDRGRYLDRWACAEDGSWRITSRRMVSDIQQVLDTTASPEVTARRDQTDPSFELFTRA
jgi:hypothetical protein